MNQSFIEKLNEVLEQNYQNENFGVSELALAIGISRSQLHRKLQEIKGLTVSQFVKIFRLEKAHDLLQNNTSTVSEIAYSVGFGSPSYFTRCFHKHYGISPNDLKTRVGAPIEASSNNNPVKSVRNNYKKNVFIGFTLFLIAIICYTLFFNSGVRSGKTKSVSIAVMPFKSISNDESNEYFADGVMDVVMSHLSSIKEFKVISRTTMEQYRETDKTVPEIAKELEVSHVLEASVQKYADKVRIVVQLIDAKNDSHVWSDDYERDYKDIFLIQSDLAKEVANKLEMKLTSSELKSIEKTPTENIEAYNLYLKGQFFWERRNKEDMTKSISYFEQAIALDSTYALAYAGLSDAYQQMAWWRWADDKEGAIKKAKKYAEKALSLDNLAQPYATLGELYTFFERDWKKAEKAFKQAIALDPDYGTAHQYYAELLNALGRKKEAREQIDLALKLNPNSGSMHFVSAEIYYNNYEFENTIKAIDKEQEITGFYGHILHIKSYIRLGQNDKAAQHLIKEMAFLKNDSLLNSVYKESGINGLLNFYIDTRARIRLRYSGEEIGFSYIGVYLADFYCITGQYQKALDNLEACYEADFRDMISVMHSTDLEPLKEEPRYKALLKKLNL
ncbi:helix-turn-helix domain-containing protein [Tamlana flava]|uniref:helix-turn-helix domain-containing protein n=1 Tax=Tamlana flava TaxID=3158572 RepID=UPI00351B1259